MTDGASSSTFRFGLDKPGELSQILPLSMVEMRWLMLEMAKCQSLERLFALVSDSFGSLPDVALARIWLLEQNTLNTCTNCSHFLDCLDHRSCLRLASSVGHSIVSGQQWNSVDGRHSRFPLGVGKVGTIALSGEPFHVGSIEPDMDWVSNPEWIKKENIRTFLGQPLMYKGEVLGVFAIFSRGIHGVYVMERIRMVSDYLAISIANARAFDELNTLRRQLEIENHYLKNRNLVETSSNLIGESAVMRKLKEKIMQVARLDVDVLVIGESGTGKEMVATELHNQSRVSQGPLVKVNCASIPRELFESEFFGHVKGAFTGAVGNRVGFFEAAGNGTLFLDEIGEIPMDLQSKLLRVLQEKEYHRVGEEKTRKVNTRIIAATNRDLRKMVREGTFREDLYYRLNVFPIMVAPLRERKDDIPLLAENFLMIFRKHFQRNNVYLSTDNKISLMEYDWPGNIRELKNVILRAFITSNDGNMNFEIVPNTFSTIGDGSPLIAGESILNEMQMREFEEENLRKAMDHCHGKIYGEDGAARLLGINPTTLSSRMNKLKRKTGRQEKCPSPMS